MAGFSIIATLLVVVLILLVLLGVAFGIYVYRSSGRRTTAKKKSSDDSDVQNELISLAAHQLRTPLSVIDWYSESLISGSVGALNEQQHKYIEEIYQANKRTLTLVNMLLNTSRLDSGKFVFSPEPTNIVRLVNGILSELSSQIEQKKIALTKEFEENIPTTRIDKNFMQVIVENIILNAVHYTPSGGSIWVSLRSVPEDSHIAGKLVGEDSVMFSVQDTGIGIPKTVQSKVFSKLFRAENAREQRASGTGLGLYIAKSILDQIDGQIWFTSEEGVGTTFYVTVPVHGSYVKGTPAPTSTKDEKQKLTG